MNERALEILAGLARNPAVPFHEWGVAEHILGVLATLSGVEYGRDDFGNIIAHYIAPSIAALPEAEREPPSRSWRTWTIRVTRFFRPTQHLTVAETTSQGRWVACPRRR